jgi:hypothetical protein
LERSDAAGERAGETRILRPDGVFDPDFRRHRPGNLVAIVVRIHTRRRIGAQVAVIVDDAGRDPLTACIQCDRAVRRRQVRADRLDLAALDQDGAVLDPRPCPVEHCRIGDQQRL